MANLITEWLNTNNFTQLRDKFNAIVTVLKGGEIGQYLRKSSSEDGQFEWATPPPSIIRTRNIINIGDIIGSDFAIDVTFLTPLSDTNYIVLGSFISNGTETNDNDIIYSIKNKTVNGFRLLLQDIAAGSNKMQNIDFEYIVF